MNLERQEETILEMSLMFEFGFVYFVEDFGLVLINFKEILNPDRSTYKKLKLVK